MELGIPREELLERISGEELLDYFAYSQIEPFGDWWRAFAMIATVQAKCWSTKSKKIRLEDFMPIPSEQEPQKPEEILSVFKSLQTIQEAKHKRAS